MRRIVQQLRVCLLLAGITTSSTGLKAADFFSTEEVDVKVETVAAGLSHPWGVEVLPDGELIVTERTGQMRIVQNGEVSEPVKGVPTVAVTGQGGLLDVALDKDFGKNGVVYVSFSEPESGKAGTAIARAKLVNSGGQYSLTNLEIIFSMEKKSAGSRHFGSRIKQGKDGTIFFTIGDRGESHRAQDKSDTAGSVLRINSDGSIPSNNPFVGDASARNELWSIGHRNPQGMDIDIKTGQLYIAEHGAKGGDEVNQPMPGKNYGWPTISYGTHYSGHKIGVGTKAPGLEQPLKYWDPSIAPGGMVVYRGKMFPEWDGDFLVTALKDQMLVRLDRNESGKIVGEEHLFKTKFGRMREVIVTPDGSLLILTDEPNGQILKVTVRDKDADSSTTIPDSAATNEKITIMPRTRPIMEGEIASFKISSNVSGSDTEVRISVAQSQDYIFTPIPDSITLENGMYDLSIPTHENAELNPEGGVITVKLIDTDDYEIPASATEQTAVVNIMDNEVGTDTQYSVASIVISSILMGIPDTPAIGGAPAEKLPVISIESESTDIEEGSAVSFTITASKQVESDITVRVRLTQSGDFLAEPIPTDVEISSGTTSARITLQTQDDNQAESDGTIVAEIGEGQDYVVGAAAKVTVNVSDSIDRQTRQNLLAESTFDIASHTLGLMAAHSHNTITDRLGSAFAEGGGVSIELGGNTTLAELLHDGVQSIDEGMKPWREVLGDSSFEIALYPEEKTPKMATFWGLGNYSPVIDSDSLAGEVFNGHLGFDATVGERMVAGLSSSNTEFDLDIESGDDILTFQIHSTGVQPYVGFESANGDRLQLIAGYGLGEIKLDQNGYATEILASSFFSLSAGGEMKLHSSESFLQGGTSELSINGESWLANQFVKGRNVAARNIRSDGHHLMVSVAGAHEQNLENGTVKSEVSLKLREDGMKHQSFLGIEMSGGLDYENIRGYRISSNGEMLLADASEIQEWGVSGQLTFDSSDDRLGVILDIESAWGRSLAIKDSPLWGRSIITPAFDTSMQHSNSAKIIAEVGYGIEFWQGKSVFTPNGSVALTQYGNEYRLGSKLNIGSNLEFELEGSQTYQLYGATGNEVNLETVIKW